MSDDNQGLHLTQLIKDLKQKNDSQKRQAAVALKDYVKAVVREQSGEFRDKFIESVDKHIYKMMFDSDVEAKKGAIMAIGELIASDAESSEDNASSQDKAVKFANFLRNCLPNNDAQVMTLAANAIGQLAKAGSALHVSTDLIVEFEATRALEWLQPGDRFEQRRHAAVLLLLELATSVPTLFHKYMERVFDLVWVAVRDKKEDIQIVAANVVRECLKLIAFRESSSRNVFYSKTYSNVSEGFRGGSDAVLGSLRVVAEMLPYTHDFLNQSHRFEELCEQTLKHKGSRNVTIKRTVIALLPKLAAFNKGFFVAKYLHKAMQHVLQVMKKERDKDTALRSATFIAAGQMAVTVGKHFKDYVADVISYVGESMMKKRIKASFCHEALTCTSLMAEALGPSMKSSLEPIMDLMFSRGLSPELTETMTLLSKHIPDLAVEIQHRMLDLIAFILSGEPYRHPGTPARVKTVCSLSKLLQKPTFVDALNNDMASDKTKALALETLGTFALEHFFMLDFIHSSVLKFFSDPNPRVRKQAVLTCARVLATAGTMSPSTSIISERLLQVTVADPATEIRVAVMESLDSSMDQHLAQEKCLRLLFLTLNDQSYRIRELALVHLGRMAVKNPAYILPTLRQTLKKLLMKLDYSGDSRNKEESAFLLKILISSCPSSVRSYVHAIMKCLLPKIADHEAHHRLPIYLLTTVGELSKVGAKECIPYLTSLLPQLIDTLQDQSSIARREIALTTLGELIEHTGYVIQPYLEYPQLLTNLLNGVYSSQSRALRRQVIKLIGIIGALDPLIVRREFSRLQDSSADALVDPLESTSDAVSTVGSSSAEYYPNIAVTCIMSILQDSSLSSLHKLCISTLMQIFQSLGLAKTAPFLGAFVPALLELMNACEASYQEVLFQHLGTLVLIVKQHIRNHLPQIFKVLHQHWESSLFLQIFVFIEEVSLALKDEFKQYLGTILPRMLAVLQTDHSPTGIYRQKVLHALEIFGNSLDEYLDLVISAGVELFEQEDSPAQIRVAAVETIGRLCRLLDFTAYSSRLIHALCKLAETATPALKDAALNTLFIFGHTLGEPFLLFAPTMKKAAGEKMPKALDALLIALEEGKSKPPLPPLEREEAKRGQKTTTTEKISVNPLALRRVWDASQLSATKESWFEWVRKVSVELLKQSSSPALRACGTMSLRYPPLARKMFNAGFVSCWTELNAENQQELMGCLETALLSPAIPAEVLQQLLNLAEFMDRDGKPLPIEASKLGALAIKCSAYAKALRYKEMEYLANPTDPELVESLIEINNSLHDARAADGILLFAKKFHNVELKSSWYEKLKRWDDALTVYEKMQEKDPLTTSITVGRMRCLEAMGEWEALSGLCATQWKQTLSPQEREDVATLGATAAFHLRQWHVQTEYTSEIPETTWTGTFYRAIGAVNADKFDVAKTYINRSRDLVDTELAALVGESYNRAYTLLVQVQQLAELEEVVMFKSASPERCTTVRQMWVDRLEGNARSVPVWQSMLSVRSLVLSPDDDEDEMWIRFAKLAWRDDKMHLSERTITRILGYNPATHPQPLSADKPPAAYVYLGYLWVKGEKQSALDQLRTFVETHKDHLKEQDAMLLARCYLTQGSWQRELSDGDEKLFESVLDSYSAAAEIGQDWYKAWHEWAMMNFEVVDYYEKKSGRGKAPDSEAHLGRIRKHLVPAVDGFFRAISLNNKSNVLQVQKDTLRLLTLWFRYGYRTEVEAALLEGIDTVPISTWLQVIPQVIARIHTPNWNVRNLIHVLLARIGKEHPQALVYPLAVAAKSSSSKRRAAASSVMDTIREHSAALVDQAMMVSRELIRVAIVWNEMWFEAIEDASRFYFNDHNLEAMLCTLAPLHQLMDERVETQCEVTFVQAFGRDLREARDLCKKYLVTKQQSDISRAWDFYLQVFRSIQKQLPKQTSFELHYTSPKLAEASALELAVPGTYKAGSPVVTIASFDRQLTVITSSKRPRKCTVRGSDGTSHKYLLKGHEDLRQDERVMQLFGLVNQLLARNRKTNSSHCQIIRFEAVPLSPNSGLLSWVPHCDTLHALIREYRKANGVLLDYEHRLMMQLSPQNYDSLTTMQKVEVFEYALARTTGDDLSKILWLKSPNAESWYEKRLTFTRSLAVMSMVGYILGLGDRHPSNLMIDRISGKIFHIDFGDCFEVAMHRERYAEKIPFRLTRMLVNAMEVSGISGNYRATCGRVMGVLRENRDSLMAVLEAFVYDPLISWKILNTASPASADGDADTPRSAGVTDPEVALARELLRIFSTRSYSAATSRAVEAVRGAGCPEEGRLFHILRAYGWRNNQFSSPVDGTEFMAALSQLLTSSDAPTTRMPDTVNEKALEVVKRVNAKLKGRDFILPSDSADTPPLNVASQVDRLVREATSHENLCQCYIGWCPFW